MRVYTVGHGMRPWCHRRLIADLVATRGHEVFRLIRPRETRAHRLGDEAEAHDGKLYLCGALVA